MLGELRELALAIGRAGEPLLESLDETAAARKALAILAEAELLGWSVPKQFGGADSRGLCAESEVSVRALCAIRSALAYHSGMLDVMFVMQGLGSYPIARGANDELKRRILPRVAVGESIAAFALTEPEAGSDLGSIALAAKKHHGAWKLNGAKTFISNAGVADFYCVLARTSGAPGGSGRDDLTMFHVPANAAGLSITRFEVLGPHPIGEVRFADVEVSDDDRLGAAGEGLELALATLARFRTSVAAAANGFARRALDESIRHLSTRSQFGKPLSANQGLRFELAEMDAKLRAAELLVDEAADAVDRGERAIREVARAKWFATETAFWIADRAVQHHGGLGVRRGTPVERIFRDVRALRIYEGSSEVQKLILSRELLEPESR